jgi:primosomal protein N''
MKIIRPISAASLSAIVIAASLVAGSTAGARETADDATWSPRASERLIKLPSNFLKKAIEQDYAKSSLASAVRETEEKMTLKVKTLEDLRGAMEQAEGDLRIELRHQFLAEKRAYLGLVADHQSLRRKHARTKIRIFEKLLGKIKRDNSALTPARAALIDKQTAARARFENTIAKVDAKLFRSSLMTESKYAREYAKNVAAIEQLVQAVNAHPMNEQPKLDGAIVSREDFLRQLIGDNEATIAVLDQEQSILGYMAKLVALDAMALSETVNGDDIVGTEAQTAQTDVTHAVDFFVKQ